LLDALTSLNVIQVMSKNMHDMLAASLVFRF